MILLWITSISQFSSFIFDQVQNFGLPITDLQSLQKIFNTFNIQFLLTNLDTSDAFFTAEGFRQLKIISNNSCVLQTFCMQSDLQTVCRHSGLMFSCCKAQRSGNCKVFCNVKLKSLGRWTVWFGTKHSTVLRIFKI